MLTVKQVAEMIGSDTDPTDGSPLTDSRIREHVAKNERARRAALSVYRKRKGLPDEEEGAK